MNQEDRCQVGSVSGALHISIYGTGPGVGGWRTEKPADTLLWLPPVKWTVGPGEKEETVFGAARLHFLPQWASAAPEGHADGFACHLLFSATCFKFIIVASQLPQRQLGGLFKAKWYLRAVRRRTHTHIDTHTYTVSISVTKLHQKVIMEIRIQLSAVANNKWWLWWSVELFQWKKKTQSNFWQKFVGYSELSLYSGFNNVTKMKKKEKSVREWKTIQ